VKLAIGLFLIVLAIIGRFLPHLPNFTPVAATALLGGVILPRKTAVVLPLAAMVVSDLFLGLHGTVFWTWGSFMAIGFFSASILRKNYKFSAVVGSTIGASVFFYLVTNFGVWVEGILYPHTLAGLTSCYINALPFFRNTLLGDLFYAGMLFGAYESAVAAARQLKARFRLAG
jgi:uncharacterized membrane protein YbaN (DUF454 family)